MDRKLLLTFALLLVALVCSAAAEETKPAGGIKTTYNICWLGNWACDCYCNLFGQPGYQVGQCVAGDCLCTSG